MALSRVVSEIFNVRKCHDLEIGVKGHSRSLKVVPFDRFYMVSYYCSLVTLSLKCTVSEIFDLQLYSDLETRVRVRVRVKVIENDTIRSDAMTSY